MESPREVRQGRPRVVHLDRQDAGRSRPGCAAFPHDCDSPAPHRFVRKLPAVDVESLDRHKQAPGTTRRESAVTPATARSATSAGTPPPSTAANSESVLVTRTLSINSPIHRFTDSPAFFGPMATVTTDPGRAGGTPRSVRAGSAIRRNAGAATSPP